MKKCLPILAAMILMGAGTGQACDFTAGQTPFADYARCRYGNESIVVVDLPEGGTWQQCVYQMQAFQPAKLLAVTKKDGEREILSLNDRSQIGNPCYMTKNSCDAALKALQDSSG